MKCCPFCAEEIQDDAIICKHCKQDITTKKAQVKADGIFWMHKDAWRKWKKMGNVGKTGVVILLVITLFGFVISAILVKEKVTLVSKKKSTAVVCAKEEIKKMLKSPTIDENTFNTLLAKAESRGTVRVIIGLNVPFKPEGLLPSMSESQDQEKIIQSAQLSILKQMQGLNFTPYSQFKYIPYLAATVDASALQSLAVLPEVTTLQEDRSQHLISDFPTVNYSNLKIIDDKRVIISLYVEKKSKFDEMLRINFVCIVDVFNTDENICHTECTFSE